MMVKLTRPRLAAIFILLNLLYWIPAIPFPEQVKGAVNASLMILSMMTAVLLLPDLWDIWIRRGSGMSWQSMVAKVGLFTLNAGFFAARVWALILAELNYPDDLLHGPIGGFLAYLMGIGMFGIFFGFNSAGTAVPSITPRAALVMVLLAGIITGVVLGKLPI